MKNTTSNSRRKFIKKTAMSLGAIAAANIIPRFSAASYKKIIGSNERIAVGMMGVNSRGLSLSTTFASQSNCEIRHVCDVDSRAIDKCIKNVSRFSSYTPKSQTDIRKTLQEKDFDALVIATPDHWHAPAALLAMQAGKHVYLEKPCSHNPHEGELLVQAVKKHKKVVQMGNQRRSWPNVAQGIKELHEGIIGRPYYARAWYSSDRKPIGVGKISPVPSWLNYDLWQGPAPRRPFKDNVIHYNWHWFWHWGTGEALNNGTHMVDLARWGMNVDFPEKVTSTGGRYFFTDDWETPDTQMITFDYGSKGMITWEGRSANGRYSEDTSTGVTFFGEEGSLQINGNNSYKVFDVSNKLLKDVKSETVQDVTSKVGPDHILDGFHVQNFFNAIKKEEPLRSDIIGGHTSTLLVQLGNIAQRTTGVLHINKTNGHILNNKEAMKYWKRTYENGWEPAV